MDLPVCVTTQRNLIVIRLFLLMAVIYVTKHTTRIHVAWDTVLTVMLGPGNAGFVVPLGIVPVKK